MSFHVSFLVFVPALLIPCAVGADSSDASPSLRAGAAAVNIDPPKLPVLRNGGFLQRTADNVSQSLFARSLVLEDGEERLAICIVDTCMVPRALCDEAKRMAAEQTGIREERMLVAATHTHSAPAAMRCLGCPADPEYPEFLVPRIAESIRLAAKAVQPAQAGWAVVDAGHYTNTRRWIYLPHKMLGDPFGRVSVRAMMHPGHANPNTAGPSGPEDPDLTVLSIQDRDGRPLAVLGNFSMHYYGASQLSSDFTGNVCRHLEDAFGRKDEKDEDGNAAFVALMSQGTSGDLHYMDYSLPVEEDPFRGKPDGFARYCRGLTDLAIVAIQSVPYRSDLSIAMAEAKLRLDRRLPDAERLAWAEPIAAGIEDVPKSQQEVYAAEVHWIRENPDAELKLQAIRVGELGMTAIPSEVYGITGLKIKLQSPLPTTMNLELANGAEGYIPPPEQHHLGGYTTWPARTAGLEVLAEPKITETVLHLLEQVSGAARRVPEPIRGSYARRILASRPIASWSMDPHSGNCVADATRSEHDAQLEPGYALFLPGPEGDAFTSTERGNRAVHFAGGRMKATIPELGETYTVCLWLWNAMPHEARPISGYFLSRGQDGCSEGDHLGIEGRLPNRGKLVFYNGDTKKETLIGTTELQLKTWYHIALVREGSRVRVYRNGIPEPEIDAPATVTRPQKSLLFVGGRSDGLFTFEGKIDEVSVFDRALSVEEITELFAASK
ncbi:MAG: LamG-like jellyroll fold domain-containing protein [Pirellulaceae bacterium]